MSWKVTTQTIRDFGQELFYDTIFHYNNPWHNVEMSVSTSAYFVKNLDLSEGQKDMIESQLCSC